MSGGREQAVEGGGWSSAVLFTVRFLLPSCAGTGTERFEGITGRRGWEWAGEGACGPGL